MEASDKFGPVWEEAKRLMDEISPNDPDYDLIAAIYYANGGMGRGWKHQEMKEVTVTDHTLLIGTMTGTEASQTPKVFGGTWFSAGGWTLTLTNRGDNTGWEGPIGTGIRTVAAKATTENAIYNLRGQKVDDSYRGIVIRGGKKIFQK